MVIKQAAYQSHYDSFPEVDHLSVLDLFVIQAILHLISSDVTYAYCIKDTTAIEIKVPSLIQFSDCLAA